MPSHPKVSIIVAALNEARNLDALIENIQAQTYPNIETIIIDGGSSDETAELLRIRSQAIDFWISEPDSGIYAAWNKGVQAATGEFICFMGADDRWAQSDSVERLVSLANNNVDIVSARFRVQWKGVSEYSEYGEPWSWQTLRRSMSLSHRGLLHNSGLFLQWGMFDETFRITGDYEFLLRCGNRLRAAFLDEVTIVAGPDGISFRKPFISLWERFRAQRRHDVLPTAVAIWAFARDYGGIRAPRVLVKLKRLLLRRFRYLTNS